MAPFSQKPPEKQKNTMILREFCALTKTARAHRRDARVYSLHLILKLNKNHVHAIRNMDADTAQSCDPFNFYMHKRKDICQSSALWSATAPSLAFSQCP